MTLLSLTLIACTGTGTDTTTDDSGTAGVGCDAYLACAAETIPDQVDLLQQTYGDGGACWTQGAEAAQACEEACESALLASSFAYPEVDACEPVGGWVPEDGCPFLDGGYTITLADAGGDCFPSGFLDETFAATLSCTDQDFGEFDFFIEDMFGAPLACATSGFGFSCDDPSLQLAGTFARTQDAASGTMVIDGTDCDSGATWTLSR